MEDEPHHFVARMLSGKMMAPSLGTTANPQPISGHMNQYTCGNVIMFVTSGSASTAV